MRACAECTYLLFERALWLPLYWVGISIRNTKRSEEVSTVAYLYVFVAWV